MNNGKKLADRNGSVKPRFHIDARNVPFTDQPEAIQSPTHVLGDDGSLKPISKQDAAKFRPSDAMPMDWGANYGAI